MRPLPNSPPRASFPTEVLLLLAFPLVGCGGGEYVAGPAAAAPPAPEKVWEALKQPRPEPLPGAARVTVSEVLLLNDPWGILSPVPTAVGLQEIISAGLLRRKDVEFVDRRRFGQAAEMERRGEPRPPGAPPVGVSPGAELVLSGSWAPANPDSAYLDFRLTDAQTGGVVTSFRRSTPLNADPAAVARRVVSGLLDALDDLGRLPAWQDPFPQGAPDTFRSTGIPLEAVAAFFEGTAAEDRYQWETAREAYQRAIKVGGNGFLEARIALARVARLRAGGSLGAGNTP